MNHEGHEGGGGERKKELTTEAQRAQRPEEREWRRVWRDDPTKCNFADENIPKYNLGTRVNEGKDRILRGFGKKARRGRTAAGQQSSSSKCVPGGELGNKGKMTRVDLPPSDFSDFNWSVWLGP